MWLRLAASDWTPATNMASTAADIEDDDEGEEDDDEDEDEDEAAAASEVEEDAAGDECWTDSESDDENDGDDDEEEREDGDAAVAAPDSRASLSAFAALLPAGSGLCVAEKILYIILMRRTPALR